MFINCKFIDFLLECTYCERHASLRRNWRLVWIWPLPIHHVARSKPQRRGPVGMRWKTRDCKDVCCEPDGRTASWVNTAVLPGRVGVRELLLLLSQGFWSLMSSCYQPEFVRPMTLELQTKLTPPAECAVTYQKTLLTFWRDVYRWRRLSKWRGIMLLH